MTEYIATLICPSRARNPPMRSVAVKPNNIAILMMGMNAADSFIAS